MNELCSHKRHESGYRCPRSVCLHIGFGMSGSKFRLIVVCVFLCANSLQRPILRILAVLVDECHHKYLQYLIICPERARTIHTRS